MSDDIISRLKCLNLQTDLSHRWAHMSEVIISWLHSLMLKADPSRRGQTCPRLSHRGSSLILKADLSGQ